jgi:hypothetical protein
VLQQHMALKPPALWQELSTAGSTCNTNHSSMQL